MVCYSHRTAVRHPLRAEVAGCDLPFRNSFEPVDRFDWPQQATLICTVSIVTLLSGDGYQETHILEGEIFLCLNKRDSFSQRDLRTWAVSISDGETDSWKHGVTHHGFTVKLSPLLLSMLLFARGAAPMRHPPLRCVSRSGGPTACTVPRVPSMRFARVQFSLGRRATTATVVAHPLWLWSSRPVYRTGLVIVIYGKLFAFEELLQWSAVRTTVDQ